MDPVERYLTLLQSDTFFPELGPEFVALLEEHPEWVNTVPLLVQGTHKRTRMLHLENLGEVIAAPLVWARCIEVTYLLLRQGANPNVYITNSYTNKHIIMYCAEDQPWKLPLLFRFKAQVTKPQSVSEELNENPLTLAYLLDREIPFTDEELVEQVDTDLSSYWVWKNAFEEQDQLLDTILKQGLDLNTMHPLILKLFLCYGLNVDVIKMSNQGLGSLRNVAFRQIIEGIKEQRAKFTSFTGDLRTKLLQQSYEVLSDLYLHDLNPHWGDKEFWREKLQRDTNASPSGDLRWNYLQWYASLKLNGQVLTSYQAGLGAALTFYLIPAKTNVKVEVLGVVWEGQKGLGKEDSVKTVRQLFGITGDLSEGLEEAPELYLLGFKDGKRMPACRYSLAIDEVVVQFDTEDFMYGVLLVVKILGRERRDPREANSSDIRLTVSNVLKSLS